jgi:hypothetical protein
MLTSVNLITPVINTLPVKTLTDHISARASLVSLVMAKTVLTSMNAIVAVTIPVTQMLNVPTLLDRTNVHANLDMVEMELSVMKHAHHQ